MNYLIILLVVTFVSCAPYTLTRKDNSTEVEEPRLVAIVNGKRYYADITSLATFSEAIKYCEEWGLKLAEIATEAEFNALNEASALPGFIGTYWTSGRDAMSQRGFGWHRSEVQLPSFLPFVAYSISNGVAAMTIDRNNFKFLNTIVTTSLGKLCET